MHKLAKILSALILILPTIGYADEVCSFDNARWDNIVSDIRSRAVSKNISEDVINATLRAPAFIPSIVKNDKNQSEFKLTLGEYLARTVNKSRITTGRHLRKKYPTMLRLIEQKYGVPPHIILAFWGMESNYGATKSRYRLVDSFFTLMYDGRRESFFRDQMIALMKIADDNKLDINRIRGSWAGAMGHFQFIPTTLAQYGADGNGDGRIDIIDNIADAMASAGNYLGKLGWDKTHRIVRRVVLPADFDRTLLDGKTKKTLVDWANMGVKNPDGTDIPTNDLVAGLVADVANLPSVSSETEFNPDSDVQPMPVIDAYLTYPNFYRIKHWNNSNWYAIAIAELADKLKQ